jgi:transcriptional regulator with XRE-family HTH domain
MDLVKLVGKNLRRWRKERKLSQDELAFQTDMMRSYISGIERGTRNPSIKAIERLAKALKIDPDELLRK